MDNVTHSLLGVLLARASLPWTRSVKGAVWAGVLASNVPDLDIVAGPFFDDRKLGYLVHHRGYTHTLVLALALGVGCALVAAWRDRDAKRGPLVALSLVAALLHVGADGWNNYGVHPFWPVVDRWFYGDFVFIVEPLLWMTLLPLAWTTASRRLPRALLALLGVFLVGLGGVALGPVAAVALAVGLAAVATAQRRWDGVAAPAGIVVGALALFFAGRGAAEAIVRRGAGEGVIDVVLTPRAASPWCWQGILLERDAATYRATGFLVSLAPALTAAKDCELRAGERTAPVATVDAGDGALWWTTRFEAPVAELVALRDESCRVDAALRFLRAPFWIDDGRRVVVGDLRYDFEPGLGFSEIETLRTEPADVRGCGDLPPWRSRAVGELLRP